MLMLYYAIFRNRPHRSLDLSQDSIVFWYYLKRKVRQYNQRTAETLKVVEIPLVDSMTNSFEDGLKKCLVDIIFLELFLKLTSLLNFFMKYKV